MSNQTFDAAMAGFGSKATYTGAGTTTVGAFFTSEVGVIAGIVIGVLGLIVNIYFKNREDKRLQTEHDARMDEIRRHEV